MNITLNSVDQIYNTQNAQFQKNNRYNLRSKPINKKDNTRSRCKSKSSRSYIMAICFFIILTFIIIFSGIIIVKASINTKVEGNQYKYYTSINIEKDDTLWSIAKNYISDSSATNSYINEIKKINNLNSDCIYTGQNLIVYYYSSDKK